ncbi:hypothetical protein COLO4_02119 [Corchorus olitorius]|uniref:Uncharacterized protein n=1 Tax=Corchorus olitorius TaxID=93759 RepID=A0A1R3L1N5_9ROSI|nr:hypothetical protein COLO4_02119 [Corchorus olitorius]
MPSCASGSGGATSKKKRHGDSVRCITGIRTERHSSRPVEFHTLSPWAASAESSCMLVDVTVARGEVGGAHPFIFLLKMADRVLLESFDCIGGARIRAGHQFKCKRVKLLVHVVHGREPEQTRIGPGETVVARRRWCTSVPGGWGAGGSLAAHVQILVLASCVRTGDGSEVQYQFSRFCARHTDHDLRGFLVVPQYHVPMIRLARAQCSPAGSAGAAFA